MKRACSSSGPARPVRPNSAAGAGVTPSVNSMSRMRCGLTPTDISKSMLRPRIASNALGQSGSCTGCRRTPNALASATSISAWMPDTSPSAETAWYGGVSTTPTRTGGRPARNARSSVLSTSAPKPSAGPPLRALKRSSAPFAENAASIASTSHRPSQMQRRCRVLREGLGDRLCIGCLTSMFRILMSGAGLYKLSARTVPQPMAAEAYETVDSCSCDRYS